MVTIYTYAPDWKYRFAYPEAIYLQQGAHKESRTLNTWFMAIQEPIRIDVYEEPAAPRTY